jgi:hypothetical protein
MEHKAVSIALFALMLGACSSLKVTSDYDPEADFSAWQTYTWAQRTPQGDDDPRVYNDITAARVKAAANKALQAKGYQEMVAGQPDFLVAWHAAIDGKISVQTVHSYYGYGWGYWGPGYGGSQTYVNQWNEGTLAIDIIDARQNKLVWRGMAQDAIENRSSPEAAQRYLEDVLAKLMASFPTRPDASQ